MRWISPLLLLSLGLHGLGLFLPMPEAAEVPDDVEELALDSIQVSILPAETAPNLSVESDLLPEPDLVPTVEPPVVEPLAIAPEVSLPVQAPPVPVLVPDPQQTPTAVIDSTPDDAITPGLSPDKPTKPTSIGPQSFLDPAGIGKVERAGMLANFYANPTVLENELIVNNWTAEERFDAYELNYLEESCLVGKEKVTGIVGVVLNNAPQLEVGEISIGTGLTPADTAIEEWFAHLKEGGENDTDKIESTFGQSVYDWIKDEKNQVWFQEKDYESFLFRIDLNLVENSCR